MYKDKNKQKQANRDAAKRSRNKRKGMTAIPKDDREIIPFCPKGMTQTGMTGEGMTPEQDRQPVREMHELAAKPTGQTRPELMSMSAVSLESGMDRNRFWPASAEYAELCRRLTTWSIDELLAAGHSLPCWLSQEQVIK